MDHRIQGNPGQRQKSVFLPDSAGSEHPCPTTRSTRNSSFLPPELPALKPLPAALSGLCWPHGHQFIIRWARQSRRQQGRAAAGRAALTRPGIGDWAEMLIPLTLRGQGSEFAPRQPARAVTEQNRPSQPGTHRAAAASSALSADSALFYRFIYFFSKPLWNRRPLLAPVGAAVE